MTTLSDTLKEIKEAIDSTEGEKKVAIVNKMMPLFEKIFCGISDFSDVVEDYFKETEPAVEAQVKAIYDKTENAADSFMTQAENISKILPNLPDAQKAALQTIVNSIFEASSFQDLVAQHANEIRLKMKDLSDDMSDLKGFIDGTDQSSGSESGRIRSKDQNKRPDAHLLNGPPA